MRYFVLGHMLCACLLYAGCKKNTDGNSIPILPVATDSSANNIQTPVETNDPEPQVSLPGDFGSDGPEAFLMTDPSSVNRYANLEFSFSERMDIAAVESALEIVDSGGNPIPGPGAGGTFRWVSPRKVIFDPYKELKDDEGYQIRFGTSATTESGDSLLVDSRTFNVQTEPSFTMTHTVNGVSLGTNRGVSLPQATNPTVTLVSVLSHHDKVENLKLGSLDGNTVTLCSGGCTTDTFTTDLTASSLAPENGGNPYYYEI
ncbi:MAG: Ig-like domain-containing protein, partial [Leptospiraceae bacterium]|nr:Ig-like domain-containing protein [Leptospiraceae bacterium]